jgi:glycosyltransferase involved in cell wall biosynthesis
MKIGMLGPVYPYRGGIAHFTTLLAKKLIEAGHEVQVVSFKKQYPAWLYPGESDKDHSPGREKVDADYLLTPLNPLSWRRTVRVITAFQPEQVVLPWWVTIWGPAFRFIIPRLKQRGIPVTMLIHNTMPHEARRMDRLLTRRALEQADSYIVMTEKEKGRLLDLLPGAENIHIAPLPIFHAFKPTALTQQEARQRLGLPPDQPVLLYFGFIRPYKGLGVLIDALKFMTDQGDKAHLLVVGEFWEDQSKYLSQISALGLTDQVHIHDTYIPDDEIAPFFKAADVLVAPYIDGTQSAALKTALGFGLPAVVTDVITDDTIQRLPARCRVVPAGDAGALAEGIREQMQTPILEAGHIERLIDQSWDAMLSAVAQRPGAG